MFSYIPKIQGGQVPFKSHIGLFELIYKYCRILGILLVIKAPNSMHFHVGVIFYRVVLATIYWYWYFSSVSTREHSVKV